VTIPEKAEDGEEEEFEENCQPTMVRFDEFLSYRKTILSNKHGGWNKRGGGAKVAKSINVEVGITVEVGIFLKN
jgi:hypothetical protein